MYILALIFYHQQTSGSDRRYFVNYFKRSLAYPGVKIYFHIKITEIIYIFEQAVYDKQDLSAKLTNFWTGPLNRIHTRA